jgi:hypothetical protein
MVNGLLASNVIPVSLATYGAGNTIVEAEYSTAAPGIDAGRSVLTGPPPEPSRFGRRRFEVCDAIAAADGAQGE